MLAPSPLYSCSFRTIASGLRVARVEGGEDAKSVTPSALYQRKIRPDKGVLTGVQTFVGAGSIGRSRSAATKGSGSKKEKGTNKKVGVVTWWSVFMSNGRKPPDLLTFPTDARTSR